MARRLRRRAQRRQRSVRPEHDRVLERAALREAALHQRLDLVQETERAVRRDLAAIRLGRDLGRRRTASRSAPGSRRSCARGTTTRARRRAACRRRGTRASRWGSSARARRAAWPRPTALDRVGEHLRAAVLDRDLRAVDRDQRVVDAAAEQRRKQVLDGRDAVLAQAEHGRADGVDDVVGARGKLDRVVRAGSGGRGRRGRGGRARAREPRCGGRRPRTRSRHATSFDTALSALLRLAPGRLALFQGVDPSVQFRQLAEIRLEPHVVAVVLRRLAGHERAVRDVAPDVRAAADRDVVADRRCGPGTAPSRRSGCSRRSSSSPPGPRTRRSRCACRCARCGRSGTGCRSWSRSRST